MEEYKFRKGNDEYVENGLCTAGIDADYKEKIWVQPFEREITHYNKIEIHAETLEEAQELRDKILDFLEQSQ